MDSSNQLIELEDYYTIDLSIANFGIRISLEHPEHFDAVVALATTLIVLATGLLVIRRLKNYRQVERFGGFGPSNRRPKHSIRTLKSPTINGQMDVLAMKQKLDISLSLKYGPAVTEEQLIGELHNAANKCHIKKYALRCIDLLDCYPHLINEKCGSTGLTPFHRVCFRGEAALIEYMLSMGADPYLTTDAGENAICLAVHALIHKTGHIGAKDIAVLDILHRAGCSLEENSIWYNKLMQMAFKAGKLAVIRWLISNRKAPKFMK